MARKFTLPTNLDAATCRALIDLHIAAGTVKVTRCAEHYRDARNSLQRKRGGVLPGHLNPVTMPDPVPCES